MHVVSSSISDVGVSITVSLKSLSDSSDTCVLSEPGADAGFGHRSEPHLLAAQGFCVKGHAPRVGIATVAEDPRWVPCEGRRCGRFCARLWTPWMPWTPPLGGTGQTGRCLGVAPFSPPQPAAGSAPGPAPSPTSPSVPDSPGTEERRRERTRPSGASTLAHLPLVVEGPGVCPAAPWPPHVCEVVWDRRVTMWLCTKGVLGSMSRGWGARDPLSSLSSYGLGSGQRGVFAACT